MHSSFSIDGNGNLIDYLNWIQKSDVRLTALTDHNTIEHLDSLLKLKLPIHLSNKIVAGLELSCDAGLSEPLEIHLLVYFGEIEENRWDNEILTDILDSIRSITTRQFRLVCEAYSKIGIDLNAFWNIHIQNCTIKEIAPHPFIANLYERQNNHSSELRKFRKSLFKELLHSNSWIRFPGAEEIIKKLSSVGAFIVLAHPYRYGLNKEHLVNIIEKMHKVGLGGIESFYPKKGSIDSINKTLFQFLRLVETIGSDVHDLRQLGSSLHLSTLKEAGLNKYSLVINSQFPGTYIDGTKTN